MSQYESKEIINLIKAAAPEEKSFFFDTPLGRLSVTDGGGKIVRAQFEPKHKKNKRKKPPTALLQKVGAELNQYFQGKRKEFSFNIDLEGTLFQKKVWRALLTIPYGQTRSYKDIAKKVKNPKGTRAVGGANNKNPAVLFVPCHRVVNADGSPGGYAFGIKFKKYLLSLELNNTEPKPKGGK